MAVSSAGIVGRIDNPAEFSVADLALEGLQIVAQVIAEVLRFVEEFLPVGLELRAQLLLLAGRGGVLQFDQQQILLSQVLIPRLVERQNEGFYIVRNPAQVALQISVVPILRHDRRWWV